MSTDHSVNDSDLELLSRSIDEDLSDFELKRLSKNILSKDAAAQTWARYHAASAVMSKQFPAQIDRDFSSQVMQAIAAEEMDEQPANVKQGNFGGAVKSYMKQFTGLAVAASVAAVSVVVYQQQTQPGLLEGGAESSIIVSDKRDLAPGFQPNAAASVESVPVEFSPLQVGVKDDIITLDDDHELSRSPTDKDVQAELDIIELKDIQQ